MKTGRFLAIILFAVTGFAAGAWAQAYPPGPNGETSSSEQAPASDGQAPALAQNYPQGPNGDAAPNGETAPSLGGTAPRSEGPAPAVARVSLIHGDVSTQRGDSGDWGSTSINAPVVRGDQVATGQDARAEIQLDYANILRLAAHSQAKIADLTPKRIQVQVGQGYASYTMLKGSEADVEIDSPNVAVRPLRAGRYRVQVNSDSETDVIVREGEAEITTPQGSTRVHAGEIITVRGTNEPEYKISSAPSKDDWDIWNSDRDHVVRDSESVGHTNRYYTGVNDLDAHGRWIYVPGYGNVWQPYQEATWAPYQTGRWVWEPYYGWTWVSYEPWGWAPYHYGRWFYYGNNWCWWPGPLYVGYRPLWSPAFVFFVGFGHRSGFGFGSIGWFPVGPHDPFYPWYGRGFHHVNVVNITVINNFHGRGGFIAPLAVRGRQPFFSNAHLALTNPRVRGSITSVSAENFGRGGHEGWRHGVDEHELRESRVMTANLPVVPSRESLHASSGNSGAPAGIQTRNSDRFFTKHAPPAAKQESFHDQMQRVQRVVGPQTAGASHGNSGGANARTGNTEVPKSGGAANGATNASSGQHSLNEGGRRIDSGMNNAHAQNSGSSTGSTTSNSAQDHSRADHSGWNKFGSPSSHSGGDLGNGRSESPGNPRSSGAGVSGRQNNDHQSNGRQINGRQINDRQMSDHQINSGMSRSSDRGTGQTSHAPESGGWQKFPSSADHGSSSGRGSDHSSAVDHDSGPGISAADRVDHASQGNSSTGNSRPPLDMHRPIVTPREQPGSAAPAQRSQPRYNPPAQHNEPRQNPPAPRGESRGSYSGSGSHNSGGGSSRSGGGGGSSSHGNSGGSSSHSGGSHSESHSSSGSSSHHR
ncbi:MAG: DUF6600 domain-containing protein [Terriglobales bacterium]